MEEITFLLADVPLTKAFRYNAKTKEITSEPYPHVLNFSSVVLKPKTLEEFADCLEANANRQHCLLKGKCHKTLKSESRAGSTVANDPTTWICIDVDYLPDVSDPETFIKKYMPAELQGTSYVVQLSASAGIKTDKGFAAHLFFELSKPVEAPKLKRWLKNINLHPSLAPFVRLNKLGTALRWPVDISTCQNDKLIYIAPPIVDKYLQDKIPKKRIWFKRHKNATVDVSKMDMSDPDKAELKLLNALRKAADLPHRTKYTVTDNNVLRTVGEAEMTGMREERGFVYFNLNGGDSWAYYHPAENCEIIYNFKGEPNYETKKLLPAYYKERRAQEKEATLGGVSHSDAQGTTYFVVSAKRTGQYFAGYYRAETNELDIDPKPSISHCDHFMAQHGQPIPDYIPAWRVEYDFSRTDRFVPAEMFINLYNAPEYIRNCKPGGKMPRVIENILMHVMAHDRECYEHFLNWLAFIVQQRKMTGTAWVWSGTQGTGKGIVVSRIIAPILGNDYVTEVSLREFEKGFNQYVENTLLVLVDEAQISALEKSSLAMERIKRYITNPRIDMTKKGKDMLMVESHMNMIFASNTYDPVEISFNDRRFNVAPRQDVKLLDGGVVTIDDIKSIPDHLQAFTNYLMAYKVDRHKAATPIDTTEKMRLQEQTTTAIGLVAQHIREGNLDFFISVMPEDDVTFDLATAMGLKEMPKISSMIERFILEKPKVITRLELQVLFHMTTNAAHPKPLQFIKMIGHHGITINAKDQYVMKKPWRISREGLAQWHQWIEDHKPKGKPDLKTVKK